MKKVYFASILLHGLLCGLALAQATTLAEARGTGERPAPAAERVEPRLDVWWQQAVFYEIIVRSFRDSTEGPLAGDGIGDLRGLIENLDYLNDGDPSTDQDLGVTALWLMPITASPSYHGYDPVDHRLVAPDLGTNQDFRDLIEACEARGMRVIVDLVLNQVSSSHPWFQLSLREVEPYKDWFVWRDEDPGYRGPWDQQVWHRALARQQYYYGLFESFMPDPNYRSESLTNEVYDIVRFWIEDMGAHGFRLDAIRHLIEDGVAQEGTPETHAWLYRFYEHMKDIDPDVLAVGEIWSDSQDISRYVGGQMDLAFEFGLAYAIIDGIREHSPARIRDQYEQIESLYPHGMYGTFVRNHDLPRAMHELGGNTAAAKLAAALQLTLPGVPFLYYGEEIGMSATKPDPNIRAPMQWTSGTYAGFSTVEPWHRVGADHETANVEDQMRDPGSMLNWYRRLIDIRQSHSDFIVSPVGFIDSPDDRLLAFERGGLVCIFNLSADTILLNMFDALTIGQDDKDLLNGNTINQEIKPYGVRIFIK